MNHILTPKFGWSPIWLAMALILSAGVCAQGETITDSVCIIGVETIRVDTGTVSVAADFRVEWRVLSEEGEVPLSSFEKYLVLCSTDRAFRSDATEDLQRRGVDTATFLAKDASLTYFFKVAGYRDGMMVSESEPFEFHVTGGRDRGHSPTPAFWFLWALESLGVFDGSVEAMERSSPPGRAAFELIAIFFIMGMLVWAFKTFRMLRSTHVFVVDKKVGGINEVDRVLEMAAEQGLDESQVQTLKELMQKTLTRRHFHGKSHSLWGLCPFEYLVRRRHRNDERFHRVATVRILKSSISALTSPAELEEAIEVRVAAEEEELRKLSFIDVLWALGVTAPLVGLFGTVTGISQSFKTIAQSSTKDVHLMSNLAEGINEALYTTIAGLIVGILFMLAFYYYNYKLDRIHAIWAMYAARFIDRFKHNQPDTLIWSRKQES